MSDYPLLSPCECHCMGWEKCLHCAQRDYWEDDWMGEYAAPYTTKVEGEPQVFQTGAMRNRKRGKGRFDLLPFEPLLRLAQLYERGAEIYGARNWEKGVPISNCFDSACRHLHQAMHGLEDEDHLAAVVFNIFCIIAFRERIAAGELPPELEDMPRREKKES